jgi:hypothetical protein
MHSGVRAQEMITATREHLDRMGAWARHKGRRSRIISGWAVLRNPAAPAKD